MKIFRILAAVILMLAVTACANNGHKKYKKKHSCRVEALVTSQPLSEAYHSA